MDFYTTILLWLAKKADPQSLAFTVGGVFFGVEAIKRLWRHWLPASTFDEWWVFAALIGAGLGMALIEVSAAGAAAGLALAVFNDGSFNWIRRIVRRVRGPKGRGVSPLDSTQDPAGPAGQPGQHGQP